MSIQMLQSLSSALTDQLSRHCPYGLVSIATLLAALNFFWICKTRKSLQELKDRIASADLNVERLEKLAADVVMKAEIRRKQVTELDKVTTGLKEQIAHLKEHGATIALLRGRIGETSEAIAGKNGTIEEQQMMLKEHGATIAILKRCIGETSEAIAGKYGTTEEQQPLLKEHGTTIAILKKRDHELKDTVAAQILAKEEREMLLAQHGANVAELKRRMKELDETVVGQRRVIEEHRTAVSELRKALVESRNDRKAQYIHNSALEAGLDALGEQLKDRNAQVAHMQFVISEQAVSLDKKDNEMVCLRQSWKVWLASADVFGTIDPGPGPSSGVDAGDNVEKVVDQASESL